MALIDFYVRNQKLSKNGPKIISGSVNYVDCSFTFKTDDWNGSDKWVVFKKGNETYRADLIGDSIPRESGLHLGEGIWNVSLFGMNTNGTKITTNSVTVEIEKGAEAEGESLPALLLSESEQISAKVQSALEKAEAVEKAAAEGTFVGERGPQGLKGETGEKGEKGDKGDTGEQGPKGEKGDTGDRGIQGETGPKGETGEQGPRGIQGIQGPKGDKGEKGEQGPQGEPGKGLKILGYYSSVSALSSAVLNPEIGDIYGIGSAPPYNLYAWDGALWIDNGKLQGAKGDKGDKGETGEQGPKGEKGEQGEQGIQGVQGIPGEKGADGAKGEKGDKGDPGINGTNGTNGVSCTHSWNGTTLTVTSASGSSSANLKGDKGDKGDKGETGATGPAYTLTSTDKTAITNQVLAAMPYYNGAVT